MSSGKSRYILALILTLSAVAIIGGARADEPAIWRQLDSGLDIACFAVTTESVVTDSALTIVRIDPDKWEFKLMCRSRTEDNENLTARQWCEKYHLVAAVNAGMFQQDYTTHVGYVNIGGQVISGRVRSYLSAVAFGPKRDGLAPFRIFDLDRDSVADITRDYETVCQNMRLIARPGENKWSQQDRQWTEVALGEDDKGRALLIHCGRALPMHDFNELLLSLPIGVVTAQHLEGGAEAQLYLKDKEFEIERLGSFGIGSGSDNAIAYPIPNVIGISRKK